MTRHRAGISVGAALFHAAMILGLFWSDALGATGPSYYDYLEQGYREVAHYAIKRAGNQHLSQHFTAKAQLAAADQAVEPDVPVPSGLPLKVRQEMLMARQRLTGALSAGAQQADPRSTAVALVNFDCWIAQFKNGDSHPGSTDCQRLFYLALAHLPLLTPPTFYPEIGVDDTPAVAGGSPSVSALGGVLEGIDSGISAVADGIDGVGETGTDSIDRMADVATDPVEGVTSSAGDAVGGVKDTAGDALGGVNRGALGSGGSGLGGGLF